MGFYFKAGLSPLKKGFISFNENPLKLMKNTFYFILKAFFVLKLFKFLQQLEMIYSFADKTLQVLVLPAIYNY